jgi:L-threonylcarbamoyladenylate synthase
MPVTSANRSGMPEEATAAAIAEQLGESIDLILDGGPAHGGPPSTVVDCSGERAHVLRPGSIDSDAVSRVLEAVGLQLV